MPDPFFEPHRQESIPIRDFPPGKSPLFYPEVHMMGAIFTADIGAIRAALPDRRCRPLQIFPGIGLVAIHCLEYKSSDIGPYNEVSLSIPIYKPGLRLLPPQLAAARALLTGSYHACVQELPVSTEVALAGGVDYFNFPKYLADISFRETATHRVATVRDKKNFDLIAEFSGRKIEVKKSKKELDVMTVNTYPKKDGVLLHSKMALNRKESAMAPPLGNCSLRLGRHPRAEPFKNLKIQWPLHYLFAPRCQAILFMPKAL